MAITKNDDLIVLISSYPESKTRIFYGITKEGKGFFNDEKKYIMDITYPTMMGKYESEIFFVKLSDLSSSKEYLLSFGKTPQLAEIYDLNSKKMYSTPISSWFYNLYDVHQIVGAYLKLTTNDYNYYLIGLLSVKYNNYGVGSPILSLIKFRINQLSPSIQRTYYSKEIDVYNSKIVSCYEISTYCIICFYKNKNNKYTMRAFASNLDEKQYTEIAPADENDNKYFKCVHFYGEIGAFLYYSNDNPPYANIVFKKYTKSTDKISNAFSKLNFSDYLFYYNCTLNDIIKVSDKKIIFAVVSLDKLKLYIIFIYNYNQQQIMRRIYELNSFSYNDLYFYNTIRIQIYNNYLAFGSNGFSSRSDSFSSLIIFSYPNSTDINNEITQYLLEHNDIKISNIKLEIQNLCKVENNVFGYILTGIKIIEIYKNTNKYLSLEDGTEIETDMNVSIDTILKLIVPKNGNSYTEFTYGMKYVCQAKEPEYEEYNKYPISILDTGTSNKEDSFFVPQIYSGRHSYYYFLLDNKLTEEGCDKKCELCYYSNKNNCITCKYNDFDLLEGTKKCNELMTTILTTIPEKLKTTTPEIIETTIPEVIETTIVEIKETTIPEELETTIPEIKETTIPKEIETTIPEIIETTVPEVKETINPEISNLISSTILKTIIESINSSIKEIINENFKGELTGETPQDIYLYIKNKIIKKNVTEENLLIKTPSVDFQLTTVNYQKNNNLNISTIDLGECEDTLRKEYNIDIDQDLIIFKIDIKDSDKSLTYVQYEVYHPETFNQLNLDFCENLIINVTVPANLDPETILLYQSLNNMGYNLFNSNDDFYTDICTPYTSLNNTDILLIDRKTDLYNKYANISVCQENCNLESYNENSNTVSCYCNVQTNDTKIDLNIDNKFNLKTMTDTFYNYLNNSNFRILKCYKVSFDLKSYLENIGRIIMTIILLFFIILFILFIIKGDNQISSYLKKILNNKFELKENNKNFRNDKNIAKNKNIITIQNNNNKKKLKEINNKINKIKFYNKNNDNKRSKANPSKKSKLKINITKKKDIIRTETPNNNKKMKYNKYNKQRKINNRYSSNNTKFIIQSQGSTSNACLTKNFQKTSTNKMFAYNKITNFGNKETKKNDFDKNKNELNDQELNSLDYNKAIFLDKRNYFQYYCSLLKIKHLILFTFLPINDYNLQYIKLILFLLSFSLYFSINGFFFTDETMIKYMKVLAQ